MSDSTTLGHVYAATSVLGALVYRLRAKGLLTDDDINKILDDAAVSLEAINPKDAHVKAAVDEARQTIAIYFPVQKD